MAEDEFLIPPLRPGASVAVIAPAGPPKPGRLDPVEGWLRERGYAPTLLPSWGTVRRRVALPAYLGTVALFSAALTAWFVGCAGGSALSLPWVAFVALLLA